MIEIYRQTPCGGRRMIGVVLRALAGAALLGAWGATAQAQCVGDCDGDGRVEINELITGVNISLGNLPLSNCPEFDANDSDRIEINELIAAVSDSLEGCGPRPATPTRTIGTPPITPTPTATRSTTPGACATNTPVTAAGCGDGEVDFGAGETCDDGNTDEGDSCPGNCRIVMCEPSQTQLTMRLEFDTTEPDVFVQGLQLFVRYPETVLSLPGENDNPAVIESVSSANFSVAPFDFNYGANLLLTDETFLGFESGEAATITFDLCQGAAAPSPCDLTCVVKAAVDDQFNDVPVEEVTCTVVTP
jgi:cysteine-rich repeat protein